MGKKHSPISTTVRVSISEEDVSDIKRKLNAVSEKLKEVKLLAKEVTSILGIMKVSISMDPDSSSTDGTN